MGESSEKKASCNIMLERAALSGYQAHEDEEGSHKMKYFPPVVYIL